MEKQLQEIDLEKIGKVGIIVSTFIVIFYILSGYKTYLEIIKLKKEDGKS